MKIKVNVFVKILAAILDIFSFVCTDRNDESERNRPKMYTALSEKSCINNNKKKLGFVQRYYYFPAIVQLFSI